MITATAGGTVDTGTIDLGVPLTPPDAPTGVTATGGDGLATVSWNPPVSTGGGALGNYVVTSTPDSKTCTWPGYFTSPPSCVVYGLTNGTDYTFTVTASNEYYTSLPSPPSAPIRVFKNVPAPITWAAPDAITYGTPLSATQLDASSSVPGTFSYSPPAGTVLSGGQQTLLVTFTPTDLTSHLVTTTSVPITVNPAPTSTLLTISGSGNPYTLSANVTTTGVGAPTPSGSVVFSDGSTVLGTQTIDPSGRAVATFTLGGGPHSLTAGYAGTGDFAASTSTASSLVVSVDCAAPAAPGVDWYGCDLSGTNLSGIDLTGADLENADLTNADLTNANLTGTNQSGTTLTGATLTGVRSGSITGTPVLPTNWNLSVGYLVGPGANLDGAVLTYNDPHLSYRLPLHGVDLSGGAWSVRTSVTAPRSGTRT